jgi:hypothetical protein
MPDMTEEEYDALDELLTRTTPKLTDIPGVFGERNVRVVSLDELSYNYFSTLSIANHKTPSELIAEMVREKLMAQSLSA